MKATAPSFYGQKTDCVFLSQNDLQGKEKVRPLLKDDGFCLQKVEMTTIVTPTYILDFPGKSKKNCCQPWFT